MKSFSKLCITVMMVMLALWIGVNGIFINTDKGGGSRPYRVEAERIAAEIKTGSYSEESLEKYQSISHVEQLSEENQDRFYEADSDYLVKIIDGNIYRFDYVSSSDQSVGLLAVNGCLATIIVFVIVLLIILRNQIIQPFEQIRDIPFELAKGNLTIPLKETKSKYFGRFTWGLDLLRERLEQQKESELKLQKEHKTFVLSLSHDIKTPLGVIALYAKALEKGLYQDEEKKHRIACQINEKCDEIKGYVDEIIRASKDDFLNLEVKEGEFYLSEVIDQIDAFYTDKLDLLKIGFAIQPFSNCILKGDADRAIEVLQNIMENAIKYGDGTHIDISFETEEDSLLICVRNSGCHLSENELTHIFDSFWRGSNVGSNSGSGLGLYICRQLMHKMSGDIFAMTKDDTITICVVFGMA